MSKTAKISLRNFDSPGEAKTERAEDRTMEFLSLMVHDLQGPVASMKTLLKLLASGRFNFENDLHAALIKSTKNAIERSESIIQDMLDVASFEKMGLVYRPSSHDLREIIANSIDMISGSAFDYGVTIQSNLPPKPAIVDIDKDLLLRVVDNLLFNALKHSPQGKIVQVNINTAGNEYIVSVSDEGKGLGDVDPNDLFDKYRQVALRGENQYRGVGLGLYFCKLALDLMGGRIWAENIAGGGACFKLALKFRKGCDSYEVRS